MDHYMEPLSSQAIVDEDNQDAIVNANVAELKSQCDDNEPPLTATPVRANNDDNIPQHQKSQQKTQHRLALVVENILHHHRNERSNLPPMMLLKKKMSSLPL